MRRIFYLYIITHIAPLSLSYPPSPLRPPLVLSPPFLLPRIGSFFPFLVSRFSYTPRSPVLSLLPVTSCIYFILLLNKPLPVILAPTCVFTRTWDPRQTQSPLDARISLRDRSRHEKYFFPTLPFVLGIILPSRVPSVIWERWALIATLEGVPSWRDLVRVWGAIKNPSERVDYNEYSRNAYATFIAQKFISSYRIL